MSDEEIIKRRLLIDGDGTGEDRRINMLLKQFLKWVNTKNDTPENNQIVYNRLLAQLAQCEFHAAKNAYTMKMIEEERKHYTALSESIEANIELAKKEIEESKRELAVAKQIRKNKMEYDLLAKVIKEQPDRKETTKQIEILNKELAELMEKRDKLERKFQKRRNDFALLMYAAHELQVQLEEDTSSESGKSDNEEESKKKPASPRVEPENNGIMDILSDDEEDNEPSCSKATKRRSDQRLGKSRKIAKADDDDLNEIMSVDEDAVLELSIDKDEKENVTQAEEKPTTT